MSLESAAGNMFEFATMSRAMEVKNFVLKGTAEGVKEQFDLNALTGSNYAFAKSGRGTPRQEKLNLFS